MIPFIAGVISHKEENEKNKSIISFINAVSVIAMWC